MAVQRHAASRHAANERENDGSSEVSGIPSMVLSAFSQATKSVGRSVGRWRAGKRIPFGPAVRWPPLPLSPPLRGPRFSEILPLTESARLIPNL